MKNKPDVGQLRDAAMVLRLEFENTIARKFPGCDKWHWSRACAAIRGENVRRNDDTSQDTALAADKEIRTAYDCYIKALHLFYEARDGRHRFLGARR
jgi:hypothetical protein